MAFNTGVRPLSAPAGRIERINHALKPTIGREFVSNPYNLSLAIIVLAFVIFIAAHTF